MQDFVNSFRNSKFTRNDYWVFSRQDDQAAHQTYVTAPLIPQVSLAVELLALDRFPLPLQGIFQDFKNFKKVENHTKPGCLIHVLHPVEYEKYPFGKLRKHVQTGAKWR